MADGVICTKEDLAKSSNGTGLVCLTRDQSIGLTLAAEAGCISLVAVVGIFVLILVSGELSVRLYRANSCAVAL